MGELLCGLCGRIHLQSSSESTDGVNSTEEYGILPKVVGHCLLELTDNFRPAKHLLRLRTLAARFRASVRTASWAWHGAASGGLDGLVYAGNDDGLIAVNSPGA